MIALVAFRPQLKSTESVYKLTSDVEWVEQRLDTC